MVILIRRWGNGDGQALTRLLGQAVKTSPFHGGNTGSIPVGVIDKISQKIILDEYFNVCYNIIDSGMNLLYGSQYSGSYIAAQ